MFRATIVKLLAVLLIGVELTLLPSGALRSTSVVATLALAVGFLAWAIVSPRAQFFVESIYEMPVKDAVAFTFDDGPDPETTPRVLELLARHGARATFFLVGARAERHPELVTRIVAEGHAIGSHTFTHSHFFHFFSPRAMRAEVERGIEAIAKITGAAPRLFRPPQGLRTPLLRDALRPLEDLVCVTWTERGLDAMGRPANAIIARLEPRVAPGAILTLHDGKGLGGSHDRSPTIEALGVLLDRARERNLRCIDLAGLT
jgi:peptidoglycan-N-acetylglucosamine deacetylase